MRYETRKARNTGRTEVLVANLPLQKSGRGPDAPQDLRGTSNAAKKRRSNETIPPPAAAPFKPDRALEDKAYNEILDLMQNKDALSWSEGPERLGKNGRGGTFRQHFLVQAEWPSSRGAAFRGDRFNYEGKTDILIRVDGKKHLHRRMQVLGPGPPESSPLKRSTQLLGISELERPPRLRVVIFNRNKDFSKRPQVHNRRRRKPHSQIKKRGPGNAWRDPLFGTRSPTSKDANREACAEPVMVFDIPQP